MIQSALAQRAINAALRDEWQAAIDLNLQLLEQNPDDLDSLNRLARAYLEIGDLTKSKRTYKDVLSIDPYNVIALKNMKRFQLIKGNTAEVSQKIARNAQGGGGSLTMPTFIEEPGKTKVVQLVRPAAPGNLITMHAGERVRLESRQRGVHVMTEQGMYVGRMPDDLAFHMLYFMNNGNKYEAFIKQIVQTSVHIFIREISRADQFAHRPTFSVSSDAYIVPTAAGEIIEGDELDDDSED